MCLQLFLKTEIRCVLMDFICRIRNRTGHLQRFKALKRRLRLLVIRPSPLEEKPQSLHSVWTAYQQIPIITGGAAEVFGGNGCYLSHVIKIQILGSDTLRLFFERRYLFTHLFIWPFVLNKLRPQSRESRISWSALSTNLFGVCGPKSISKTLPRAAWNNWIVAHLWLWRRVLGNDWEETPAPLSNSFLSHLLCVSWLNKEASACCS